MLIAQLISNYITYCVATATSRSCDTIVSPAIVEIRTRGSFLRSVQRLHYAYGAKDRSAMRAIVPKGRLRRSPAKSEKPISMVPCAIRQSHLRLDAGVNCVTAEFERIKGKFPVGMHTYVIDMPDGGFQVG